MEATVQIWMAGPGKCRKTDTGLAGRTDYRLPLAHHAKAEIATPARRGEKAGSAPQGDRRS